VAGPPPPEQLGVNRFKLKGLDRLGELLSLFIYQAQADKKGLTEIDLGITTDFEAADLLIF